MVSANPDGVLAHASQAREFLNKAREYLAAGDLHQASEKGWGRSRAHGQGRRPGSGLALRTAQPVPPGDEPSPDADRQRPGAPSPGRADVLHVNFYELSRELDPEALDTEALDPEAIGEDLLNMAELLDLMEPLTNHASAR